MAKKQFCKNHPAVYAEYYCFRCNTPLCIDCRIIENGMIFCSLECYQDFRKFSERQKKLAAKKKQTSFDAGKWIPRLVLLAALGAALYYIFAVHEVRSLADFDVFLKYLSEKLSSAFHLR